MDALEELRRRAEELRGELGIDCDGQYLGIGPSYAAATGEEDEDDPDVEERRPDEAEESGMGDMRRIEDADVGADDIDTALDEGAAILFEAADWGSPPTQAAMLLENSEEGVGDDHDWGQGWGPLGPVGVEGGEVLGEEEETLMEISSTTCGGSMADSRGPEADSSMAVPPSYILCEDDDEVEEEGIILPVFLPPDDDATEDDEDDGFDEALLGEALCAILSVRARSSLSACVRGWGGAAKASASRQRAADMAKGLAQWNALHSVPIPSPPAGARRPRVLLRDSCFCAVTVHGVVQAFMLLRCCASEAEQRERDAQQLAGGSLLRRCMTAWGPLFQIEAAERVGEVDMTIRLVVNKWRVEESVEWWRCYAEGRRRVRGAEARVRGLEGRRGARVVGRAVVAWRMCSEWRASLRPGLWVLKEGAQNVVKRWALDGLREAMCGGGAGAALRERAVCRAVVEAWGGVVSGSGAELGERASVKAAMGAWAGMFRHWKGVRGRAGRHGRAWGHIRVLLSGAMMLCAWREVAREGHGRVEGMEELLEFHCFDTRGERRVKGWAVGAWRAEAGLQAREERGVADGLAAKAGVRLWRSWLEVRKESKRRGGMFAGGVVAKLGRCHSEWCVVRGLAWWLAGTWKQRERGEMLGRLAEGRARVRSCRLVLEAFGEWREARMGSVAEQVVSHKAHKALVEAYVAWRGECGDAKAAPVLASIARAFGAIRSEVCEGHRAEAKACRRAEERCKGWFVAVWRAAAAAGRAERAREERLGTRAGELRQALDHRLTR